MKTVKWKYGYVGLSKVKPESNDFHITPVLTLTSVIHASRMGKGKCLALEWGHWAIWVGRFVFDKPSAN